MVGAEERVEAACVGRLRQGEDLRVGGPVMRFEQDPQAHRVFLSVGKIKNEGKDHEQGESERKRASAPWAMAVAGRSKPLPFGILCSILTLTFSGRPAG